MHEITVPPRVHVWWLTPLTAVLFAGAALAAAEALPWQRTEQVPVPGSIRPLDSLFDQPWRDSGGAEGKIAVGPAEGGGRQLRWEVAVDHHNGGAHPLGWPSFEIQPKPGLDWSGANALRFQVRATMARERPALLRFILWTGGALRLNEYLPPLRSGEWVTVTWDLRPMPARNQVERVHFYVCESDYTHGDQTVFEFRGFELCSTESRLQSLGAGQAGLALWVGERADAGDRIVLLDDLAPPLPLLLKIETGSGCELRQDDALLLRYRDVFTDRVTERSQLLGQAVAAGTQVRLTANAAVAGLQPGYYLVTADLRRADRSLLGGRVGGADLYVRAPGESMGFSVLSVRTGMCLWVKDLLHGGMMCRTAIALPHAYDPLERETYPEFIRLFAQATGKHSEGNEAGCTGLALAAAAFRAAGATDRQRFAEALLDDACRQMLRTQAPAGAFTTWSNELTDQGIGKGGGSEPFGSYDSNQVGETVRALTYAILYYRTDPERRDWVRELDQACFRACEYLVAHSAPAANGQARVLRHLRLDEAAAGTVTATPYVQEGRPCDVYLGRALAGLSYYAYARQLLGEDVPAAWWPVLDDTVTWCARKMKADGWFDWQCEDVVEGGCHTFLGNLYVGEGLFGCYLADRVAGRTAAAASAQAAAHRGYRYVTDACVIRGKRFAVPLEFWVGPYVYWLFTEWQATAGPDPAFQDWLSVLDRSWSQERAWADFLDRAPSGGCGRTDTNGMLEISILGYLGIRDMAAAGKPLAWPLSRTP